MNINIKTTSFSITDAISEYVSKKLQPISDLVKDGPSVQCDVELARTTNHHKNGDIYRAEIHIVGKEKDLYASSEQADLYAAIDLVKDEMVREITTAKDKKMTQTRKGGLEAKNIIKGLEE